MDLSPNNHGGEDRAKAIARLINEVREALDSGQRVELPTILQAHPELMPDLEAQLKKLLRIRRASKEAPEDAPNWPAKAADALAAESRLRSIQVPGYELLREIGRGGQAVVYLAIQQSTGRKRALKLMREGPLADPSSLTRFEREIETLASLNHPNIVPIIDTGRTSDGRRFLAMDYIEGTSLDEFMKDRHKSDPADPSKLLRLFLKLCAAVSVAHRSGVIHRDLKPSNILVDERGQPHILDFGLARTALDRFIRGTETPVSVTGEFLGSLPWSSPEQAEGLPDKIDHRTDVYSLGVILYQILTGGKFPYTVVGNIRDVLNNILTAEPTPPSKAIAAPLARESVQQRQLKPHHPTVINEAIETIVLKALAKNRDARYQSAAELGRDISNYLAGMPLATPKYKAGVNWLQSLRRKLAVFVATAAIGTASIVAAYFIITKATAPPMASLNMPQGSMASALAAANSLAGPSPEMTNNVDLLKLVDPEQDSVRGTWLKTDNLLKSQMNWLSRIEFPYQPPEEYDYQVEFKRTDGMGELDLICCKGDKQFAFVIGQTFNRWAGLKMVDLQMLGKNSTSWIHNPLVQTALVKVRKDRVSCYLDGNLVVESNQPFTNYSLPRELSLLHKNTIGLVADNAAYSIESAHLFTLGDNRGKLTRPLLASLRADFHTSIDLLKQVDPAQDTVAGQWSMDQGSLACRSSEQSRIQIPYLPPEEYDYRVTFMRNYAGAGPVCLIFPANGRQVSFYMDGGTNRVDAGFGLVDGGLLGTFMFGQIEVGRESVALVKVRKFAIRGYLDGQLLQALSTDNHELGLAPDLSLNRADTLGFAAANSDVTVESAELLVGGALGHPLRGTMMAGPAAVAPNPVANGKENLPQANIGALHADIQPALAQPADLLQTVQPATDAVQGTWTKKADGSLSCAASPVAEIEFPGTAPGEYDFQVQFTRRSGEGELDLIGCQNGKQFAFSIGYLNDQRAGIAQIDHQGHRIAKADGWIHRGQKCTALLKVRKNALDAYFDGKHVIQINTDGHEVGLWPGFILRHRDSLGLAVDNSVVDFQSIKILPVEQVASKGLNGAPSTSAAVVPVQSPVQIGVASDAVSHNGHHFKLFAEPLAWNASAAKCHQIGGHLAYAPTNTDLDFLEQLKGDDLTAWIGGSLQGGAWTWGNGKVLAADQSSSLAGETGYNWVYMTRDGKLSTRPQDGKIEGAAIPMVQGYICEWDK